MELAKPDIFVEQSSSFEESSFSISEDDMGLVFEILRSKVYSDPIGSICREICSNARDANREVGKGDIPISIKMEKTLDSETNEYERDQTKSYSYNLIISDQGPGISPERMKNVFLKYAASTKRSSNTFTGGFGLGAKTPFAYTDKFSIETTVNGIKYLYVAVVDESQKGKILLIDEKKTKKENGTSIIIPIKNRDITQFEENLLYYTMFWKVRPKYEFIGHYHQGLGDVTNYPDFDFSIIWNTNHSIQRRLTDVDWVCLIDEIPYIFQSITAKENTYGNHHTTRVLHFKNSELDITVNRENLQFTDKTKEKLLKAQEKVIAEASRILHSSLEKCESYLDFLTMVESSIMSERSTLTDSPVGHTEAENLLYYSIRHLLPLKKSSYFYQGKPYRSFDSVFSNFEVVNVEKHARYNTSLSSNIRTFRQLMGNKVFISSQLLSPNHLYERYFHKNSTLYTLFSGNRFTIISPKLSATETISRLNKINKLREKIKRTVDKKSLEERLELLVKGSYTQSTILDSLRNAHWLSDYCSKTKRYFTWQFSFIDLDTINVEKKERNKREEKDKSIIKGLYLLSYPYQQPLRYRLNLVDFEKENDNYLFETFEKERGVIVSDFAQLCCSDMMGKKVIFVEEDSKRFEIISSIMNSTQEFLLTFTPSDDLKKAYYAPIMEEIRQHQVYLKFLPKHMKQEFDKHFLYSPYSHTELLKRCVDKLQLDTFKIPELDILHKKFKDFIKLNPLITHVIDEKPSKIRYYLELEKFKRAYAKQRKSQVHNH